MTDWENFAAGARAVFFMEPRGDIGPLTWVEAPDEVFGAPVGRARVSPPPTRWLPYLSGADESDGARDEAAEPNENGDCRTVEETLDDLRAGHGVEPLWW